MQFFLLFIINGIENNNCCKLLMNDDKRRAKVYMNDSCEGVIGVNRMQELPFLTLMSMEEMAVVNSNNISNKENSGSGSSQQKKDSVE